MQLSELKTLLKRTGFSDSDPLSSWLNIGMNWVLDSRDWPFLIKLASDTVVAGTPAITLPTDFRRLITLKCVDTNNKLDPMEITEFEREISDPTVTGPPMLYLVFGDLIDVYPTPDATYNMRLFYIKNIPALSLDTDEPELPNSLHYAVVQAAATVALQAENEEERAQTAEQEFESTIARAWRSLSGASSSDEYRTVTDVMGYTGGY